jgi:Protein of unknown function (DUF2971)
MQQVKPERLFRFFSPNDSEDFFSSRRLWFSAVEHFNDPFEFMPSYDKLLRNTENYEEAIRLFPDRIQREFGKGFGVVCFIGNSKGLDRQLMWAHYAKNHRGFAVEFDPNHKLFQTNDGSSSFRKITYLSERKQMIRMDVQSTAFEKSLEWKHEEEFRLIMAVDRLEAGERELKSENGQIIKKWSQRYFSFTTDLVRNIYLGCRMADSEIEKIRETLKHFEWGKIGKFAMRIHKTDYAIEQQQLSEWKPVSHQVKDKIESNFDKTSKKCFTESEREMLSHTKQI